MKDAVAGFALLAAAVLGGPRGGRLGGLAGSTDDHRYLGMKYLDKARASFEASKTASIKEKRIAYALDAFYNAAIGMDNALWSESQPLREEATELLSNSSARLDKLVFAAGNPLRP